MSNQDKAGQTAPAQGKPQVEPPEVTNKEQVKNDNEVVQLIEVNGKQFEMRGTVNITLKEIKDVPVDPDPEDPNVPVTGKPTEGTVLHGGWGANMDPKTWVRTNMRNPATQFKVVDGDGKNVATNFTTPENADNFIKYFQRHPDKVSEINKPVEQPTPGGEPGQPGGTPGGTDTTTGQTVAGINFPVPSTGKTRVDDYHNNPNDGLRIDFEGNPKDGSFVNSALAVYGTFVDEPTGKEDRCVKWSWARHTGNGTRVNTYIVNIRNSDGASRMRFEQDHPNGYHTLEDWGTKGTPAEKGKLWSIMGIRRTIVDANGKPTGVKLEVYEDQGITNNQPGNKWVKLREHVDTKYKIFDYPNGMEVTGRFDDEKDAKNIKIAKAVLIETQPIKSS